MSEVLQVVGCLAAAGLAAAALLSRSRRLRAGAVVAALVIAAALVVGEAWDDVESLRDRPALFGAAIVLGAAALAALAALIRRVPLALPLLLVAALPFRVPIGVGTEDANLLLPLYLVIGAGAIAAAIAAREAGGDRDRAEPRPLLWALAAAVVLYAAQSAYSEDIGFATRNVVVLPGPVRGDVRPAHRRRLDAAPARPRLRGDRRRGRPVLAWSGSARRSPARSSGTRRWSSRTTSTSTSASTRSSGTRTSTAAIWRWWR